MSARVVWIELQRRRLRRDRYRFAVSVDGKRPVVCIVPVGPRAATDAKALVAALVKGEE